MPMSVESIDRNRVDLAWERCQEQALCAFGANDAAAARTYWARALDIAERHFERGDPRLAASRSNQAFALLRQNRIHEANALFRQAVAAWDDSWRWVPWMAPSAKPGEIETAPFDCETQDVFRALVRQGRAMTEALWREHRLTDAEGDDWPAVKPKAMTDVRRLFSAVFLMPRTRSRRDRSMPGHRVA